MSNIKLSYYLKFTIFFSLSKFLSQRFPTLKEYPINIVSEEEKNHYLKIRKLTNHGIKYKFLKMLGSLDDAKKMLHEDFFRR